MDNQNSSSKEPEWRGQGEGKGVWRKRCSAYPGATLSSLPSRSRRTTTEISNWLRWSTTNWQQMSTKQKLNWKRKNATQLGKCTAATWSQNVVFPNGCHQRSMIESKSELLNKWKVHVMIRTRVEVPSLLYLEVPGTLTPVLQVLPALFITYCHIPTGILSG